MAWQCSAQTNARLVDNLCATGIISSTASIAAMRACNRLNYVKKAHDAYEDAPQYIGYNATISAPHMHGYALDIMAPLLKPGAKVLDVGCGSGYLAACMSHMVQPGGKVIALDHIPDLVNLSQKNMAADHPDWITENRIQFVVGDGRMGYPAEAPYDVIHVGAASAELPDELVDQLKSPGMMVIPLGPQHGRQYLCQIDKDSLGKVTKRYLMSVGYIPLTDRDKQFPVAC